MLDESQTKIDFKLEFLKARCKDPEHLIEKIIRKRGIEQSYKYRGINVSNYKEIIRDIVGVRILILYKEEWEAVYDWIRKKFDKMEEPVQAYTRYGDRDIFHNKIVPQHSNKGYRSQHYIIKFQGVFCEIQVRTLAEEVYGEFDHHVKYPYRNNNKFLKRYTSIISQLTDSIDECLSTCFQMGEAGWDMNEELFVEDEYIDWKNTYKESHVDQKNQESAERCKEQEALIVANSILCRKG